MHGVRWIEDSPTSTAEGDCFVFGIVHFFLGTRHLFIKVRFLVSDLRRQGQGFRWTLTSTLDENARTIRETT
ncbi:hypothetical protein UPYG_G00064170 [Umbra pygmaea]|uniref:Uncharacterized protein n=1 Tax=Umbra pygmaea TaxID=75934 RepID=A0ABD0XA04_UMBPY